MELILTQTLRPKKFAKRPQNFDACAIKVGHEFQLLQKIS